MSRIDTAVLDLQYADGYKALNSASEKQVSIFAVNYNVLRILSGMGGILIQTKFIFKFFSYIKLDN